MIIKEFFKDMVWRHRNLGFQKTDFGTKLKINTFIDHLVFKEIFIDKIYDKFIFHALEQSLSNHQPKKVLDFGANLGFFSVRCCEIWKELGSKTKIDFVVYEPSENCIKRLEGNLKGFRSKTFSFNIRNNLVGKKSGWDWFIEDKNHHIGQCVSNRIETKGLRYSRKVDYLDLSQDLEYPVIDLIKCDIEGSEIEFVKNYGSALNNVRAIIIETHGDKAKSFVCKNMEVLGFDRYTVNGDSEESIYSNLYFIKC
jgi:FkbM family methyltransferase